MGFFQIVGVDGAKAFAHGSLNDALVDQCRQLGETVTLLLHPPAKQRPGEHELPAKAGTLRFQGVQIQGAAGIDDGTDAAQGGHRLTGRLPVIIQILGHEDAIHLAIADGIQLRL